MEHGPLLGDVAWFAQGMAERPMQVEEARRVRGNRDLFHQRQSHRRHTPGFDVPGKQSHGPRADGSGGYQQRQIDTRVADAPRGFFDRRHEPSGAAHQAKTVVILGQTPDDLLRLKLAQALDRKYQVDVPKRVGPVIGLVGNGKVGRLDVSWDDAEGGITVQMERAIASQVNATGRDQHHSAIGQGFP